MQPAAKGQIKISTPAPKLSAPAEAAPAQPTSVELDVDALIQDGVVQRKLKIAEGLEFTLRTLNTEDQMMVSSETEKTRVALFPDSKLSDDAEVAILCSRVATLKYTIVAKNGINYASRADVEAEILRMDSNVSTLLFMECLKMQAELSALLMAAVKKNLPSSN